MPRLTTTAITALVNIFWSVEPSMKAPFKSVLFKVRSTIGQLRRLFVDFVAAPFSIVKNLSTYIRSRLLSSYYQYLKGRAYPQSVRDHRGLIKKDPLFLRLEIETVNNRVLPLQFQLVKNSGLSICGKAIPKWEYNTNNSITPLQKSASKYQKRPFQWQLPQQKNWHNFHNSTFRKISTRAFLHLLSTSISENQKLNITRK